MRSTSSARACRRATGLAPTEDLDAVLPMAWITLFQKRLLGSLTRGQPACRHPATAQPVPDGQLLLDETVTREYKLSEINEGFDDMMAGP